MLLNQSKYYLIFILVSIIHTSIICRKQKIKTFYKFIFLVYKYLFIFDLKNIPYFFIST